MPLDLNDKSTYILTIHQNKTLSTTEQCAYSMFQEAAQAVLYAHERGSQFPNLLDKANEYIQRAEQLRQLG